MKRVLIIGGSGFASGAFAREAAGAGHDVSIVTRGRREIPAGVCSIIADRTDISGFARQINDAGSEWDLVVDYYAMKPADALQDIGLFSGRTRQFVFVSTDFVYDPFKRDVPQTVEHACYVSQGYGGAKRACEEIFLAVDPAKLAWITVRPNHIYGPGSLLGCLPCHSRDSDLVRRIRAGETLKLVGGGHYRQQPVFARDLARFILSTLGNPQAVGHIFHACGHETFESWEYYQILADLLGCPLSIEAVDVEAYLREHPDKAPYCCDRVYDLAGARSAGLTCPDTPLKEGLRITLQAAGEID